MGGLHARVAVWTAIAIVARGHGAHADTEVAPDAFESCRAERRQQIAEAMKITDTDERGRSLVDIAVCEGDDAAAPHVVEPAPPFAPRAPPHAAEPAPPFAPRAVLASWSGTAWQSPANSYVPRTSTGADELELGVRWRRDVSFAVYAGASEYSGAAHVEPLSSYNSPRSAPMIYAYSTRVYDAGIRMRVHFDPLWLAVGLGVRDDHSVANGAVVFDDPEILALISGQIGVSLLTFDAMTVDAVATVAVAPPFGNATDETVALGVRLAVSL